MTAEIQTTTLTKISPSSDLKVMAFYTQALELKKYAEARVITTTEDMKPELGEVRHGHDVGYKSKDKMRWQACPDCGKERWVELSKVKASRCCRKCAAKRGTLAIKQKGILAGNRFNWQGGRHTTPQGYILVWLSPDDLFFPMASKTRYVPEHRLVMAKEMGRCLLPSESVHHKNGIRNDNRIENLQLISRANHSLYDKLCAHCSLRKEIRLLSWQIKEQSEQIKSLTGRLMGIG